MTDLLEGASRAEALMTSGFLTLDGPFATIHAAFASATALLDEIPLDPGLPPLEVVGEFVIPPISGPPSRDFQMLHFDFGLPLDPMVASDVARFTALHVPVGAARSRAITRLVPLRPLLEQSSWPDESDLLPRLLAYGKTHGAWDHTQGRFVRAHWRSSTTSLSRTAAAAHASRESCTNASLVTGRWTSIGNRYCETACSRPSSTSCRGSSVPTTSGRLVEA